MRSEASQPADEPGPVQDDPVECAGADTDSSAAHPHTATGSVSDVPDKIITALDRLARARRMHRQDIATTHGLSTLQVDLVRALAGDPRLEPSVGSLAREMSVAQPTVTDSLRVLERKDLVSHERSALDRRKHTWVLTEDGARIASEADRGDHAGRDAVRCLDDTQQDATLTALLEVVASFVNSGAIDTVRTCLTCHFHQHNSGGGHHCSLLETDLRPAELRIDCPEHVPAPASTRDHPDEGVMHAG